MEKREAFVTQEKVRGAIRASKAASENQTAAASHAASESAPGLKQLKMKCFNCNKFGHGATNCPIKGR